MFRLVCLLVTTIITAWRPYFSASTCRGLQTANLRGFKLRASALRKLARANATTLRDITLPTDIRQWQLETLLKPLEGLQRLNLSVPEDNTGRWLRLLPISVKTLDITGEAS